MAISIVTGDSKALSKIKGVGKKTAERIILELRESINAEQTEAMEAEGKSVDSGRCEPLSEVERTPFRCFSRSECQRQRPKKRLRRQSRKLRHWRTSPDLLLKTYKIGDYYGIR